MMSVNQAKKFFPKESIGINIVSSGAGGRDVISSVDSEISHANLSGLGSDDHIIYFLANGTRTLETCKFNTTSVATTPYTILSGDFVLLCDTSSATITVNLPTLETDRVYFIKNTGPKIVVVEAYLAQTIDGRLTQKVPSKSCMLLVGGHTEWHII